MDHGFPQWTADAAPALLRRAFGRVRPASVWDGQDPIREELFSAGRLEDHARSLAAA